MCQGDRSQNGAGGTIRLGMNAKMKIKVSDYIADFLAEHQISTVFTVVGGGAMHLNDSLGHHEKLHCVYNHHEQASSMAAEGYFRVKNQMAAVCVTSGPGAINALNGVAGAYQDSVPLLVFSGQSKTTQTLFYSGLRLRALGNQEFDIVSSLKHMVKYAEMVMDARKIRYCLEKAYHLALSGRPGPCWLDIPLDIQGAYVDTETLGGYDEGDKGYLPGEILEEPAGSLQADNEICASAKLIVQKLKESKRPVIYAGNGIRISNSVGKLRTLAHELSIPVATCWDSIDVMETDDPMYVGRGGTMGDRAGNFAVQNSDLLLCIGTRLNVIQVGYDKDTWARSAYVVVNDIDREELKKPTIHLDLGVCCDAGTFMDALVQTYHQTGVENTGYEDWVLQCRQWKEKYPVVLPKHLQQKGSVNVYAFMGTLSRLLPQDSLTVAANGSASVVGSQSYYIGKGCRFLMNCGLSSMGYGLPSAIGACVANDKKTTICLEGDGSLMMNLQELQTMATNRLPIKLFIINNEGYHQIRLTQSNIFHRSHVGIGPQSGDLSFPDYQKLADAFGLAFFRIADMEELESGLSEVLSQPGGCICEVVCDTKQVFEPKSATRKLPDGTLVSPPLEDLAPFLPREELYANMYIAPVTEK